MCLSPVSKAAPISLDKSPEELNVETQQVQDASDDAGEERVLSAGLFPTEDDAEAERQHIEEPDRYDPARVNVQQNLHHQQQQPPVEHPTKGSARSLDDRQNASTHNDPPSSESATEKDVFTMEETLFVFDWDDTLLPSTWLQRQRLRLDSGSTVSPAQREQLATVEKTATEIIYNAKQCGKVVLVTNAERGWIELSCQKFLPGLLPLLENVKAVSARTTFESRECSSPLEWKLHAFEQEIGISYGQDTLWCPASKKNVLSLGDSVHEREAMLRATRELPNCHPKSLKFVERPDLSQIIKQHSLINSCFHRIVHHEGHLDLCIKCT